MVVVVKNKIDAPKMLFLKHFGVLICFFHDLHECRFMMKSFKHTKHLSKFAKKTVFNCFDIWNLLVIPRAHLSSGAERAFAIIFTSSQVSRRSTFVVASSLLPTAGVPIVLPGCHTLISFLSLFHVIIFTPRTKSMLG